MANSLVSFREDETRKIRAADICDKIGIDLPTYLRICITKLIQENGIPFSMKVNDVQTEALDALKRLNASAEENGISEMSLDEINAEISEARKGH